MADRRPFQIDGHESGHEQPINGKGRVGVRNVDHRGPVNLSFLERICQKGGTFISFEPVK